MDPNKRFLGTEIHLKHDCALNAQKALKIYYLAIKTSKSVPENRYFLFKTDTSAQHLSSSPPR